MTGALIDVPRCLNVDAWYVGPPRGVPVPRSAHSSVWNEAVNWGGTPAFRGQAVRECLDTIAVLRSYREPLAGETWLIPAASERRLLAQVNAIVALGPEALQRAIDLALDPDVPDPGRIFAALLVLGCVEGEDWLGPMRALFVAAMRSQSEMAAAVEALCLAPNPRLATVVTSFIDDERPHVRASAVRVLGFRGELPEADWNKAIGDRHPAVIAAALSAPLRGYDRIACERTLQPFFARRDGETLVRLALRAGLSLRLGASHSCAAEIARSDPSWADAMEILGMFGDLRDAPCIQDALYGPDCQYALRAAAVLGSAELVPALLELLDRSDLTPEVGSQIRLALDTTTGLGFTSAKDVSEALELWSKHSPRFDRRIRYRHGQPLSFDVLLESLRAGPGSREVRQGIYLEMLVATESRVPRFSAYDFVGVQHQSLAQIERWHAGSRKRR